MGGGGGEVSGGEGGVEGLDLRVDFLDGNGWGLATV